MGRTVSEAPASADTWRVAALTMMSADELRSALLRDGAWVRSAASYGIAAAQLRLGRMLLEGEGVAKDQSAAFENFRKASIQGDIEAHNMLGRCHENGWGTNVNQLEAAHHYRIAAEAGFDWAQYNLGHMRLSGHGGPPDREQAFGWYNRAAAQGHVRAMNLVGRCHEQGWGTPCDPGAALFWYRQSARGGYFRGAFNYASVLATRGCLAGARFWFTRAIDAAPEPSRSNMIALLSARQRGEMVAEGSLASV